MKKSISTIKTYSFPGVKDLERGIKKLEKKGYKLLTNEFNGLFKKVEVENAKEGKIKIVASFIKYEGEKEEVKTTKEEVKTTKEEVKTEKVTNNTKAKNTEPKAKNTEPKAKNTEPKAKKEKTKKEKTKKGKTDKKLVATK